MSIILGIDVGGSTTKIVGLKAMSDNSVERLPEMLQVKATDQITSMYGAIGNFLSKQKLSLNDVKTIYLTGVGASFINENVYGINTIKVDEFTAIGRGALHLAGLDKALVVSMGTGTAFISASNDNIKHIGGTGVGGGTVIGLSSLMIGKNDIDAILALAEKGEIKNIDLTVGDIMGKETGSLLSHLTAANFGKIKSTVSKSDIALGIINMVFEAIGMLSVFALKDMPVKTAVLVGSLAVFPQAETIFKKFEELTGIKYIIPNEAVFATALGAIEV